ncbi:MAG: hypothetical protein ACLT46_08530 [Hungatella sp.]
MMGDFMATLGMLLALVGIIAASWAVSRFLGRRFGTPSSGKTIQILEQVPLGRTGAFSWYVVRSIPTCLEAPRQGFT